MIIKFLPHGKGDPFRAAAYVLDDKDHLNLPRSGVAVLRGDPMTFASIAQSSPHKHRYTSVVIAWAAEDKVGIDEINEVLDAFEQHAFAGLKPHQYHMTAVMHEEEDQSRHVHILIPRIELTTDKSLNIAPPMHRYYFDPLRDYFNYKYDWARPDDPARARSIKVQDHLLKQNAAALRANLVEQPKATRIELINQFIEYRMLQGVVYDRSTVVQALAEIGSITRMGQDYISLRTEAGTDRLKAPYYEQQFYLPDYLENRRRAEAAGTASAEDPRQSAARINALRKAEQRIQDVRAKRQQYNERTYREPEPISDALSSAQSSVQRIEATIGIDQLIQSFHRGSASRTAQPTTTDSTTDGDRSTDRYRNIRDIEENREGFIPPFIYKQSIQRGNTQTVQIQTEYRRNRTAFPDDHRQTAIFYQAIYRVDDNQHILNDVQHNKRFLNARIPYRAATSHAAAHSTATTRKSSLIELLTSDQERKQRLDEHHRIAANLSSQITAVDRQLEQRTTAQRSTDRAVSELFIQQHRDTRSKTIVQYLGALVKAVSGYLSRVTPVSRASPTLHRGKTWQLFEQFRDATYHHINSLKLVEEECISQTFFRSLHRKYHPAATTT